MHSCVGLKSVEACAAEAILVQCSNYEGSKGSPTP